ncbi:hypothetical protein GCM10011529_23760 [Polymorphobacter glacialis]|uniref:Uncharacterized protein n=1 Tax=Sandarakinorhabdus glacialis TaxID=1614636 RepID=A0A916ZW77_9SPHN|nr:hypothetical protein [Polymorphobacter glacialis]GGE16564.1 hypothetical protein GCM10011529_23760 [Polymorphobacter glacialis]
MVRQAGIPPGPSASPILGGSQVGANLGWTPDPLARRPFAVIARLNAALTPGLAIDTATTQAALGVRWTPAANISLSAKRLVAIGSTALDRFSLRAAAGLAGRRGRAEWTGYSEATILDNGDVFAGAQARAGLNVTRGRIAVSPGAGAWASVQNDTRTIHRLDIGPSLTARTANLELTADYRFRISGNAAPDSGPTLTISTAF